MIIWKHIKTALLLFAALLFLLVICSFDDSAEARKGEVKPWPWEQFMSRK